MPGLVSPRKDSPPIYRDHRLTKPRNGVSGKFERPEGQIYEDTLDADNNCDAAGTSEDVRVCMEISPTQFAYHHQAPQLRRTVPPACTSLHYDSCGECASCRLAQHGTNTWDARWLLQ